MQFDIIIKTGVAVLSALIGAGVIFLFKMNHHRLCSLISISAGALFAAATLIIIPEAFKGFDIGLIEIAISVISGYVVFSLISKYYFHVCPACSASHFDEQTTKKFSEIVLLMITALSLHSLFDGLALSIGISDDHFGGDSIFFAIAVHKLPEGLALASLMTGANYAKSKIILYVFLVQLITVLGAILGSYLISVDISISWISYIMLHIAGGFIYLAYHALAGEMIRNHKKLVIISFSSGFLFILFLHFVIGVH